MNASESKFTTFLNKEKDLEKGNIKLSKQVSDFEKIAVV